MPHFEEQLNFDFVKPDTGESDTRKTKGKKPDEQKSERENIKDDFNEVMVSVYDGQNNWWALLSEQVITDFQNNPFYFSKLKKYNIYAKSILGYKEKFLSREQFGIFVGICQQIIEKYKRKINKDKASI